MSGGGAHLRYCCITDTGHSHSLALASGQPQYRHTHSLLHERQHINRNTRPVSRHAARILVALEAPELVVPLGTDVVDAGVPVDLVLHLLAEQAVGQAGQRQSSTAESGRGDWDGLHVEGAPDSLVGRDGSDLLLPASLSSAQAQPASGTDHPYMPNGARLTQLPLGNHLHLSVKAWPLQK